MTATHDSDLLELAGIRAGDERAFTALVGRYHGSLVRVAQTIVHDHSTAEDVAQETWIAMLRGVDRFEQRSSLRTWLFRILVNIARARARADHRTVPFSSAPEDHRRDGEEAADAADRVDRHEGSWTSVRAHLDEMPEESLTSATTVAAVRAAIDRWPARQQVVVRLRDVDGFGAGGVFDLLGLGGG